MAKALVYRNRLVERIRKAQMVVIQSNGNWDYETPKTIVRDELCKLMQLQGHLVAVKTAIMKSNCVDMGDGKCAQELIFNLAEMKGYIAQLVLMQCEPRKTRSADTTGVTFIEYKVQISTIERDSMVETVTAQIDALQDRLNQWNHTQTITVPAMS